MKEKTIDLKTQKGITRCIAAWLFGISPGVLLKGRWLARLDKDGNVYMLIREVESLEIAKQPSCEESEIP